MKCYSLKDMKKGWFIGDFSPSIIPTSDFEVAVKEYKSGEEEAAHFHKIAREITVVVSGKVEMNGRVLTTGDIVELEPGEVSVFKSLSNSTTVVVKVPSVIGDKFLV